MGTGRTEEAEGRVAEEGTVIQPRSVHGRVPPGAPPPGFSDPGSRNRTAQALTSGQPCGLWEAKATGPFSSSLFFTFQFSLLKANRANLALFFYSFCSRVSAAGGRGAVVRWGLIPAALSFIWT